jgi:HEPN domain-containing protein
VKPETQLWIEDAEYDLESAKVMLDSGRRFFVVFLCHLTVEKLLKAAIVERQSVDPPRMHGLIALASRSALLIPDRHRRLINQLDDMGVVTRYPDGRRAISGSLTEGRVSQLYERTVMFFGWLRRELK